MNEPVTPTSNRPTFTRKHTPVPVLPRMAERAAHDLARPTKAVLDGLRAIDTWFTQHGDPFDGVTPHAFAADAQHHQDIFDALSHTLTNAELVARLRSAFAALHTRITRASRVEQED